MKTQKKTFFLIIGVTIIILVGAVIFYHHFLPGIITQKIKASISKGLNKEIPDLYEITLEEVELEGFLRTIYLPLINIAPHPVTTSNLRPIDLPTHLIRLDVKNLRISIGGLISLAQKKDNVVFSNLEAEQFALTLQGNPEGKNDQSDDSPSAMPARMEIEKLSLVSGELRFLTHSDTIKELFSASQISLDGNIAFTHDMASDKNNYDLSGLNMQVGTVSFFPEDQLYSYHCKSLLLNAKENSLFASGLEVSPLYDEVEFQNHITHQTDILEVLMERVLFSGFDINPLANGSIFITDSIIIDKGTIDVFRDRRLPLDAQRRPTMPTQLIQNAAFDLHIKAVALSNIELVYAELPEGGETKGFVDFKNLNARLENITNISKNLAIDSTMTIAAQAAMFGEASLKAWFSYNLMDLNGGYTAKGELASLNFTAINTILFPLTGARVENGIHTHSEFEFMGNDTHSEGYLNMVYADLSLTLESDRSQLRNNIVRWIGENLLYYPANPHNRVLRPGTIAYDRDITRFVFHYWWQSYLSGIKSTVLRESAKSMISNEDN